MVNQSPDDYAKTLRLLMDRGLPPTAPLDDVQWAGLARIAALIVGDTSRSFISLLPNNETQAAIGLVLQQNLVVLIETPQLLTPLERAMCGQLLSQLGDPRPGVEMRADGIPYIVWCEVPPAEFIYQQGNRLTLPAFKIAKYPVTFPAISGILRCPGWAL